MSVTPIDHHPRFRHASDPQPLFRPSARQHIYELKMYVENLRQSLITIEIQRQNSLRMISDLKTEVAILEDSYRAAMMRHDDARQDLLNAELAMQKDGVV